MRLEVVCDYHLKYDGFSMFDIKYQYVLFILFLLTLYPFVVINFTSLLSKENILDMI